MGGLEVDIDFFFKFFTADFEQMTFLECAEDFSHLLVLFFLQFFSHGLHVDHCDFVVTFLKNVVSQPIE
jgi:hypothetical protein